MVGHLDKSEFKPEENYNDFYAGHRFEPFPESLALKADEVVPRVAWAVDIAQEIEATNLLDVCCLDGFASLTVANRMGWHGEREGWITENGGMGIDLSKPGIKLANERAIANNLNMKYLELDAEAIPDSSYENVDLVLLFEAIEHFTNPDKVIEMIKKHLKPGGTLLVSTPDAEGHFGIENVEDVCHLRVYTHKHEGELPDATLEGKPIVSLPDYLEVQGFKVVECDVWNELIHCRVTKA